VRLVCPHCKAIDDTEMANTYKDRVGIPRATTVYRAVGCRECRNTGYFGRRAIFEWMDTTAEIRQLVLKSVSTDVIREAARRSGMTTLADDGCRLIKDGKTTIEEVLSVTTVNEADPHAAKPSTSETMAPERAAG
jgi:type II secretory ATPase GspE/PulE/Tfp pilus assembly ATPase PilB-like protein